MVIPGHESNLKDEVKSEEVQFVPSDIKELDKFLTSGPGKNINEEKPHLLCQYISGQPFVVSIICHAGEITYFDIHTDGSFLSRTQKQKVFTSIQTFCRVKHLTAFASFHFILEDASESIICIGCKPTLSPRVIERHRFEQVELIIVI